MPVLDSRCNQYIIHTPRTVALPRRAALPQHKAVINGRATRWESQKLSGSTAARRVSCWAQSSAMNADIEFVHPPREGKLESTSLPEKVRKQVGLSVLSRQ